MLSPSSSVLRWSRWHAFSRNGCSSRYSCADCFSSERSRCQSSCTLLNIHTHTHTHTRAHTQARELIHPHLGVDGYYLLRPSSDTHGGVLCTICVTNKSKLLNYRLVSSTHNGLFYIHNHTTFSSIQKLIEHYR